jgi:HAMP domain-containing protein
MKVTLKTQDIILMILIPTLLFVTILMAWIVYSDLYQVILGGFDKKLFAISTVMGSFIDGDVHDKILEVKQIKGMAFDPATNTLYGSSANDGYLVTLCTEDDWSSFGAAKDIGPTGFWSITGLAFDSKTRTLYGLDSTQGQLIKINTITGTGTIVGAVGIECFGLAFDSITGTLYGSGNQLIKVNTATGKGTVIGPLGFEDVRGLAFDNKTGILYGIDSQTNQLLTIDTKTGAGTPVGPIVSSDDESSADSNEETEVKLLNFGLAFDPGSNTLYSVGTDRLIKIDPATGKILKKGYSGYRNEKNPLYMQYYERMRRVKQERNLTFLYTYILTTEEDKTTLQRKNLDFEHAVRWVYGLDAEDLNDQNLHSQIGDIDTDLANEKIRDVFFKGIVHLSEIVFWQEWGLLKSGHAPIFDKKGEIRAIAGADVNVNKIKEKTNLALLKVCLVGVISLLLAGLVSFYITGKLIEPIRQLKNGSLKVAAGGYGYQIPVQGPRDLGELSVAFNNISQVLKETIEDVTQANQNLEAKRRQQELIRILAQDADGEQFPRPDVLVHSRLGRKSHHQDSSGWVCRGETSLLWLADSPDDSLQAVKLRHDISIVVNRLLHRFSGNWDAISAKLTHLFEDSVYCFALLNPGSNSVHFLTRRSAPVILIDETKKIRQHDFARDESIVLSPGQVLIISSTNWIAIPNSIAKLEELIPSVDNDASSVLSILEKVAMDLSIGISTGKSLTDGIFTVMVGKEEFKTTAKDMERIRFLRSVPIFADLDDSSLRWINQIAKEKVYAAGETIVKENDEGDALYIIVSGSVRVIKESNRQVTIAILQERDYFGEMALLNREPRSASVEAQEETKLLVITQDDFQSLLLTKSQITFALFRTLSRRLCETNAKLLESQT